MARNKDYTCDACGAQFDKSDGFVVELYKIGNVERTFRGATKERYDLCPSCAKMLQGKLHDVVKGLNVDE